MSQKQLTSFEWTLRMCFFRLPMIIIQHLGHFLTLLVDVIGSNGCIRLTVSSLDSEILLNVQSIIFDSINVEEHGSSTAKHTIN